jgi:hypothetical protein
MPDCNVSVAITSPTGTFGFGPMPLLQADQRIARVVGIARRPFDPSEHGWTKMTDRRGDAREAAALEQAFQGADGAKLAVPGPLVPLVGLFGSVTGRVPLPIIAPPVPVQFIHEDDVGQAIMDGSKARRELGRRRRYRSLEALRGTRRPRK